MKCEARFSTGWRDVRIAFDAMAGTVALLVHEFSPSHLKTAFGRVRGSPCQTLASFCGSANAETLTCGGS